MPWWHRPAAFWKRRTGAIDARLAMFLPFLWRTRALTWTGLGMAMIAAAQVLASRDISTATLPGLSTTLFRLSAWTFIAYGLVLVLIVDVVRQTVKIFSRGHAVRVFAAVFIATMSLLLPGYAYVKVLLPRVARLETPENLEKKWRVHSDHRFWRCWDEREALISAVAAHPQLIETDLALYGLTTDLQVTLYTCGWSLQVLRGTEEVDASFKPMDMFYDRLAEVRAAQQYTAGTDGSFGDYAPPYGAWGVLLGAMSSSLLVLGTVGTTLLRSHPDVREPPIPARLEVAAGVRDAFRCMARHFRCEPLVVESARDLPAVVADRGDLDVIPQSYRASQPEPLDPHPCPRCQPIPGATIASQCSTDSHICTDRASAGRGS